MNVMKRLLQIKTEPGWFYIKQGYGASLDTLVNRSEYGGRKARRAILRICRNCQKLNTELPVVTESAPWLVTPASLPDAI